MQVRVSVLRDEILVIFPRPRMLDYYSMHTVPLELPSSDIGPTAKADLREVVNVECNGS